jgi:predicted regulator of Ras-like GTPase activity (Roadblock/LC7/MglB family)
MMSPVGDANIGFTLTPEGRSRLIHVLDGFAAALPSASAILIDKAGRIVEIARKPVGVNLEAISALAAGCHASNHELAKAIGEEDFSFLFEHTDDRQVYVWPVADRGLLVVLLKGYAGAEQLEKMMDEKMGKDLEAVLTGAREPLRSVPPPRVDPSDVPPELGSKMKALTMLILDVQARKSAAFNEATRARLLKDREDLVQAMSRRDWVRAGGLIESTTAWIRAL